jgi:dGTPase
MTKDKACVSAEIRNRLIQWEEVSLSPFARRSAAVNEEDEYRLCYQRDRDRIIHSKQFRRLKGKTQTFLFPIGDHYRTRLTHTLEVSQISRTVARALRLNEDLAEAVALGHDLGHTPFGHLGERALSNLLPGGFHHAVQSVRIARQMNLSDDIIDGIEKHSKGKGTILDDSSERLAATLEGQIVRIADIIAYINHDLDDAVRAGMLEEEDVPDSVSRILGPKRRDRLHTLVTDVITSTLEAMENNFYGKAKRLYMNDDILREMDGMRAFLFKVVYESDRVMEDFDRVVEVCGNLYKYFTKHPEVMAEHMELKELYDSPEKMAGDFISGMSDNYALLCYKSIFLPEPWLGEEIFNLRK